MRDPRSACTSCSTYACCCSNSAGSRAADTAQPCRPPASAASCCARSASVPVATNASASSARGAGRSRNSWQRDAIVGRTAPRSTAVSKNTTNGGGSSRVLSRRLPASSASSSALTMRYTFERPMTGRSCASDWINSTLSVKSRGGPGEAAGFIEIMRRSGARRTTRTSGCTPRWIMRQC